MLRCIVRNHIAMSPVISTVILVSVVIIVAITSSYWMGALASRYTIFEQIEVPVTYAEWDANLFANGGWNITIELKNSGSADTTVDNIMLNISPIKDYTVGSISLFVNGIKQSLSLINIYIPKGDSVILLLQVERFKDGTGAEGCTPGTHIDLKIHATSGGEYPIKVKLL